MTDSSDSSRARTARSLTEPHLRGRRHSLGNVTAPQLPPVLLHPEIQNKFSTALLSPVSLNHLLLNMS